MSADPTRSPSVNDPDRALGEAVGRRLPGRPPGLLVQSSFSLLQGTTTPERWGEALAGLYGSARRPRQRQRGGNHPALVGAGLRRLQDAPLDALGGWQEATDRATEERFSAIMAQSAAENAATGCEERPSPWGCATESRGGSAPSDEKWQEGAPATDRATEERFSGIMAQSAAENAATGCEERPSPWGCATESRGGSAPSEKWAALCDHGDLAGLPAAIDHWGRDRVAAAASVALHHPGQSSRLSQRIVLLAPDEAAYRQLCLLLSWRHEAPDDWQAWLDGRGSGPELDSLVALCPSADWLAPLADLGADSRPHAADRPWRGPEASRAVAMPLLTGLSNEQRRTAELLNLIHDRSQVKHKLEALHSRQRPCYLADLDRWLKAFTQVGADAEAQVERGRELLDSCRFLPGKPLANGLPRLHMPTTEDRSPDATLRRRARQGLRLRYGSDEVDPRVGERLDHELAIIARKGFSSYILAVWELSRGRRTCGRGSGASSLVCYCLGITNVDPIRYQLVFERFLCDERLDPPDIDIDFPWDERNAVHQAAMDRYGRDFVAMIATHQTMSAKGALREAARVNGQEREATTAITTAMGRARRYHNCQAPDLSDDWQRILGDAQHLEGLPRVRGLHCGGLVITDEPVRELVPVHPAAKHIDGAPVPAIAWEKDGAEAMGLVKVDLLGNRSLAVVRDAVDDLSEDGITVDENRWHPEEDILTNRLISSGHTMGCFYIESPAMRLLNAKAPRVDFDRLVVHSSIIRPAANQWINTYLERLHHHHDSGEFRDEWFPHPSLRSLLSESYGILSYQEDVMVVARDLAGFPTSQQNRLRKALGRSDTPKRLAELAPAFVRGCRERGVDDPTIDLVWTMISSFAGYSFCKAHSASYAMVSYQCAWLKAHAPAHFLARVIANGGGFYGVDAYVEEARRCGVRILPPCVVRGVWVTRRQGAAAIRLGFQLISGFPTATAERIVACRKRRPFTGLTDLVRRARLNRRELAALSAAGAFDELLAERSAGQRRWLVQELLNRLDDKNPQSRRAQRDDETEELPLPLADPEPPARCAEPSCDHLRWQRWECIGCLPDAHPFALWHLPPPSRRRFRCADLSADRAGETVVLLARVITRKQVTAVQRKGRDGTELPTPQEAPMAFVTLEDETGICESVWFPDAYRRCGIHSERGGPFRVRGRIAVDFGVPILQVDQAFAAEENRNISGRTATDSTTRTDQATVPTGPS